MEKVPGISFELLPGSDAMVVVVEDRTSWKPEMPFMAGSFEGPVR